jgi:hypothetical protein
MFKSGLASLLQKQNAREMHPDSVPHGDVKSNCLGLLKKMIGKNIIKEGNLPASITTNPDAENAMR